MKYLLALILVLAPAAHAMAKSHKPKPAAEQPAADAKPADAKPADEKAADAKPADNAPKAADKPVGPARPLEDVLAAKEKPGEEVIMVFTNILVHDPNGKQGMSVKFVDVPGSPNVNIKKWDQKLSELKPETTIKVTGQLHFGTAGGGPSVRYKVKEVGGKKYNDHRHWRTDKAIYIINPTYEVVEGPKAEEKPKKDENSKAAETGEGVKVK